MQSLSRTRVYSTYYSLCYKEASPRIETIERIVNAFPQINVGWLLFNKGEMIYNSIQKIEQSDSEEINKLKNQVKLLSEKLIEKERHILELELELSVYTKK